MYAELPVVSLICAILVLLPLPWHWRAGTIPTISLSLWLFVYNIIAAVNTIVWADNTQVKIPVWCDIATKLHVGSNMALPAAVFCLSVNLERIASLRQAHTSPSEKRRRQIIDILMCFGLPLVYMALHYVVQGHRFDIVENFGCRANIYISLAALFIFWIPPALLIVAAGVFSALSLRHFWLRRITFARHLQNTHSALTPSRYFRLIAMALVETIWTLFITTVNLWYSHQHGLRPWVSWADVHFDFGHISQFPAVLNTADNILMTYLLWWTLPVSSIIFTLFFAFGQDAMREYEKCGDWVKYTVLRRPHTKTLILPSYVSQMQPRTSSTGKPPLSPHSTTTLAGSESNYKHKDMDMDMDMEVYDIRHDSSSPSTPSSPTASYLSDHSTYATKHHSVV